jgi:hypothetical protein
MLTWSCGDSENFNSSESIAKLLKKKMYSLLKEACKKGKWGVRDFPSRHKGAIVFRENKFLKVECVD